ncbi:MAG: DUF1552 domain-containing protein [Myxococcota bacterium]
MLDLTRRRLLAGLATGAGAHLLHPFADRLLSEARGQAPTAKRFVLILGGNGWYEEHYETTVRSETDWDLPGALEPLAAYRDKLTVLERFYNPVDKGLHSNRWASTTFAPAPDPKKQLPGGPSIDRAIAQHIGSGTAFSSINLTHYERVPFRVPNLSADAEGAPYPVFWNPVEAYTEILGGIGDEAAAETQVRLAQDRSLLDSMAEDTTRLRSRLAGREVEKMDQYVESIRSLEIQLASLAAAGGASCAPFALGPRLGDRDYSVAHCRQDVIEAHLDIIATSFACGLTRVAALDVLAPSTQSSFDGSGYRGSHHSLCHDQDSPGAMDNILRITRYQMTFIRYLWAKLSAIPEGSGTVADNTLLMWLNVGGGSHHNGTDEIPILLLGDAGGTLRSGRYVSFPKMERSIGDVFTTVAQAVGAPLERFGVAEHNRGPLPGLLS